MALKSYKPITPGRRFMQVVDRVDITKQKPHKALTFGRRQKAGPAGKSVG